MNLEEMFLAGIEDLGPIRYSKSFGWICIYTGRNLFGGYNIVDNDILVIWLILSPKGYNQALENGFSKFDFGKTWAETEVTGEDDLPRVLPFIKDAFNFTKTRKHKKK